MYVKFRQFLVLKIARKINVDAVNTSKIIVL